MAKGNVNVINKYKGNSKIPLPNFRVNPKIKQGVEYCQKKCESIWSYHVNDGNAIKFSFLDKYAILRAYGSGDQDPNIYKKRLGTFSSYNSTLTSSTGQLIDERGSLIDNGIGVKDAKENYDGINYQVVSMVGPIKAKVKEVIKNRNYQIRAKCTDPDSIDKETQAKYQRYVEGMNQDLMDELEKVGVDVRPDYYLTTDKDELEMLEANGEFKLEFASQAEKLIRHTFNDVSEFEDELTEKVVDDLVDVGYAACKTEFNKEIGKEVVRYVDPLMAGIQESRHNDFKDSMYAYEIVFKTVADLRAIGIPEEKLKEAAYYNDGLWGNVSNYKYFNDFNSFNSNTNNIDYDNYRVAILDTEWLDNDDFSKIQYTSKRGDVMYRDYVNDRGKKISTKEKIVENWVQRTYKAKWLIGTDICYEYGLKENVARKERNCSTLSYKFVKTREKSIIERIMPYLDLYVTSWYRFQDAVSTGIKSGYVINVSAINNLNMNGKNMDPLKILEMLKKTGVLFWKPTGINGMGSAAAPPIQNIESKLLNDITNYIETRNLVFSEIESVTGINQLLLGAAPEERQGKATTEMSMASSIGALQPLFDCFNRLKKECAIQSLLEIQLLLRNSPECRKAYSSVIGEYGVKSFMTAESSGVKFGLDFEPMPDDNMRSVVFESAKTALAAGRQGQPGLQEQDFLEIVYRMDKGESLYSVSKLIGKKIRDNEKRAQELAIANQQANAEYQMQAEQQRQQMEAQKSQFEAQYEFQKMQMEQRNALALEDAKAENDRKLEEIKLKYNIELERIRQSGRNTGKGNE